MAGFEVTTHGRFSSDHRGLRKFTSQPFAFELGAG
jgi:hypothetical protein